MISLVPMIDVMLILLVFFMVTSSYLNLDMIPAASASDQTTTDAPESSRSDGANAPTMLIRLGTDGLPSVRGQLLSLDQLHALLKSQLAETPLMQVIILPLGGANMQTLVSVMEQVTRAGGQRLRVVRLEARP